MLVLVIQLTQKVLSSNFKNVIKMNNFFKFPHIGYLNSEAVSVVFLLEKSNSQMGCETISSMSYLQTGGRIGRNFGNQS